MIKDSADPGLYPQLLGDAWETVAGPVRWLHSAAGEKRGRFRVTHGGGRLARFFIKWSRLPKRAECARALLTIVREGGHERWERSFDGVPFVSEQWRSADGNLVERIGAWELRFRLRVEDGAMRYFQRSARYCFGALRLPHPLAPHVTASESAVEATRVSVSVSVSVPLIGQLIAYDGWMEVEGAES